MNGMVIGGPDIKKQAEMREQMQHQERVQDLLVLGQMLTQAGQTLAAGSVNLYDAGIDVSRRVFHELGKWLEVEDKRKV